MNRKMQCKNNMELMKRKCLVKIVVGDGQRIIVVI